MRTIHGFSSGANNSVIDSAQGGHHHDKTVLSAYEACSAHIQRGELTVSPAGVFWLEPDPARGCNTLWHLTDHGPARLGPQDLGIRSRVNGYGGGALAAAENGAFVVGEDQQIRFVSLASGECVCLTDDPEAAYGGLVA